ncbi:MAG TPA: rhomboid family intramembrane serine protease [Desulfobulbaceae bacterium]|nr:rhomboid family intramembrane serine protease [Desulfobulbaceae bacterium]
MPEKETQHIEPGSADDQGDPVVASGSPEYLADCSLVLSAVGIKHSLNPQRTRLTVPAELADLSRDQLESYFEENRGWPERPPAPQFVGYSGNPPTLLTIGSLAVFYLVTGPWQDDVPWFARGAIDSSMILEQGQWWRLITALTLHADQVHLLGNCIIGGFIVHLLSRTVGYGLASLLLVFCGALGNFCNISIREAAHLSVGFSTAIFAGIGLLSGLQVLAGPLTRLRTLLVPIGAGAGLLAMLGTEGERTDLGAHLFGFLCGLVLGILARQFRVGRVINRSGLQEKLFVLTLAVILISWSIALN